mmetsp:Transcript_20224/g.29796  ORF Transcript_20224/g.29796 Transcript_20224/m.29796 type:complete len:123 (-) Transcript_20224:210-578(-)
MSAESCRRTDHISDSTRSYEDQLQVTEWDNEQLDIRLLVKDAKQGILLSSQRQSGRECKKFLKRISPDSASIGHDTFRCASQPVGGITHDTGIEKKTVAVVVSSNDPKTCCWRLLWSEVGQI